MLPGSESLLLSSRFLTVEPMKTSFLFCLALSCWFCAGKPAVFGQAWAPAGSSSNPIYVRVAPTPGVRFLPPVAPVVPSSAARPQPVTSSVVVTPYVQPASPSGSSQVAVIPRLAEKKAASAAPIFVAVRPERVQLSNGKTAVRIGEIAFCHLPGDSRYAEVQKVLDQHKVRVLSSEEQQIDANLYMSRLSVGR